jgi:hypothetical protein
LANELATSDVKAGLAEDANQALRDLDATFGARNLPVGLDLAITGGQGVSIAALIGLTADHRGVSLPIASWGAGTRRLAALAIAEQKQGERPVTLVDEIERGLEPYRQCALLERLQSGGAQVFVTTHSPAAIASASRASLWYVDHKGQIGALDATKLAKHRICDPDTFLSRLAIIAEGAAEVGFASSLLERALGNALSYFGIHISLGGGHELTLELLEELKAGGLSFGGFADNEGDKYPTRWRKLVDAAGPLLFRWRTGCLEENVFSITPDVMLERLMTDPRDEWTGVRRHTLAHRLGIDSKAFADIATAAGDTLKHLMLEEALGIVPAGREEDKRTYRGHARSWFKSVDGGRELAEKVFDFGLWPALKPQLLPFCNGVRVALGLPEIEDLPT